MFDPGKILKVKVEVAPGDFGYGRATIIDRLGSQILIQVKTAKDTNKVLPKGTRLWFTNDSPKVTFNGMWASAVVGTQAGTGQDHARLRRTEARTPGSKADMAKGRN